MIFMKNAWNYTDTKKPLILPNVLRALFIGMTIGLYDSLYGPGGGTIAMLLFTFLLKYDVRTASGNAKLTLIVSNYTALLSYILSGNVFYMIAIPCAVSNVLGNYIGAGFEIKNGAKIGTKLSAAPAASDFIIMAKAPEQGTDFDAVWRNADGSLNPGGLYETADSSSYKTMGYHMYNGSIVVPPTTTTSTSSEQQTTTTTTTAVQPTETTTGSETSAQPTETTAKTSETSAQPTETAAKTSETSAQPTETTAAPATSDTADTTEQSTATTPVSSGDSNTETTQTTASEVTSQSLYGDVNLDGKVDITDAVLLNKAVAGVVTLNASQQKNADCMADGELSTNDSTVLLQFLVRIVTSLPVTE